MTQSTSYDAIIIGAGHNGLVCAGMLAKAGLKVLVLEQNDTVGGAASSREVFSGYRFTLGAHDAGLMQPEVIDFLRLEDHGLQWIESPAIATSLLPSGHHLTLWRDSARTQAEIAEHSPEDAASFGEFSALIDRCSSILRQMMLLPAPNPAAPGLAGLYAGEAWSWMQLLRRVRGLGRQDAMGFLRIAPMGVQELLDQWFQNQALKGLWASFALGGTMQGPMASGTAFLLLYHSMGGKGLPASRFVRGGMGRLMDALATAAQAHGAELRTATPVKRIELADGRAAGVVLPSGETIYGRTVISNVDARRTLFGLVGAVHLPPKLMRRVRNIRFRGSTAKLNLALNGLPDFAGLEASDPRLTGHLLISPSLAYLEQAYEDAKYGRISSQPYLDVMIPTLVDPTLAPQGHHVMSIIVRYAPYQLRDRSWDDAAVRQALTTQVLQTLEVFAPGLRSHVAHQQLLTPLDWERYLGLTEGSIYQGQMALDQMLFMRPIAGYGRHGTPVDGLYLCGAGTHPGGGVTGAPGYHAAKQILLDRRRSN